MAWNGDGELVWNAVTEALQPILHLEKELDQNKLEKRVRDYFNKGAKNLNFHSKQWDELIEEYADNVFGSLFCGLGDRPWIMEADFLLVVDAGVKENFPQHKLQNVPQKQFEQCVLAASDRAFDQQRYWAFRWETIQNVVTGKTTTKKIREATDTAREETVKQGVDEPDAFIASWVGLSIQSLMKTTQNEPQHILPPDLCHKLFERLVQEGGLPVAITNAVGQPPPGWPALAAAVDESYAPILAAEAAAAAEVGDAMGFKGKGKFDGGKGFKGKGKYDAFPDPYGMQYGMPYGKGMKGGYMPY